MPEDPDRDTGIITAAADSPPELPAESKATAGGASLSVMVRVCMVVAPATALAGSLKVTWMVSSLSSMVSSTTAMVIVSTVSPGAKVSVPEARV